MFRHVNRGKKELLSDALPDDAALDDLGIHPLRDLTRPEHIYRLNHIDLKSDEESLLTPSRVRNNLPNELSQFVGRKQELADVRENLRRHFEVDAESVVIATLWKLNKQGKIDASVVDSAINDLGYDREKVSPLYA